jgi:beta-lactamase class A
MNQATGDHLELNSAAKFPSASMIKVPVMYEIMRQAHAGILSLNESFIVNSEFKVDGAGILKELRPGLSMTVRELVTLMIVISDNIAANMLIDLAGMDNINRTMENLGLHATVLRRRMMDFTAAQAGRENETTAQDMVFLFSGIEKSPGLLPAYRSLMLDLLSRQQIRDKLPFYLPEEVAIAHKTGTLPGVEHDGGILYLPGGPYIICVLAANLCANHEGLRLIAHLGQTVYEHFK